MALISDIVLHLGHSKGKFSSLVSSRIFVLVLCWQAGQYTKSSMVQRITPLAGALKSGKIRKRNARHEKTNIISVNVADVESVKQLLLKTGLLQMTTGYLDTFPFFYGLSVITALRLSALAHICASLPFFRPLTLPSR